MTKPASRRISGAILATALVMTACTSDRVAVEDPPPNANPASTTTVGPATEPSTTVPTEVPAPTVEPTATPTVEPSATPVPDLLSSALIVEGVFTWPPGAQNLSEDEQAAVNVGISFNNLAHMVMGRGVGAFQTEYEALEPHLGENVLGFVDRMRESDGAATVELTTGKEPLNQLRSTNVIVIGERTMRIVQCYNFAITTEVQGEILETSPFAYRVLLDDDRWTILSLEINNSTGIRECTDEEMGLSKPASTLPPSPPARDLDDMLPNPIVEGAFGWPIGAGTLPEDHRMALDIGLSYKNLLLLSIGRGVNAFQPEFDAMRPHLNTDLWADLDRLRDPSVLSSEPTPGFESLNRVLAVRIYNMNDGSLRVVQCLNVAITDVIRDDSRWTEVFAYDAQLQNGQWAIRSIYQDSGGGTGHRECTDGEMN